MKHLVSILFGAIFTVGCSTTVSDPWCTRSIRLEDIDSITLICGAYASDGGTTTLYAVAEDWHQCTIQLNQYALPGDYSINEPDSPGRLLFNKSLVGVRPKEEPLLLGLLEDSSIALIKPDDLRTLAKFSTIDAATLSKMTILYDKRTLARFRDEINAFVRSDAYIDIANNGLSKSQNGG